MTMFVVAPTLNPSYSTRPLESYGHLKILEKQNFNKGFEVYDRLGKDKA